MALQNQQAVNYKLLILGESGTGKTTFVKRHVQADLNRVNVTSGITVYPIEFQTQRGLMRFHCWDPSIDLRDGYLTHTDCAIIMFDLTALATFRKVARLCRELCRVCGRIPIIICGNKADLPNRQVTTMELARFLHGYELLYCEISALGNHNFELPFLYFARELDDSPDSHDIRFMPALLVPPEVTIDLEAQKRNEDEFQNAYMLVELEAQRRENA